MAKIVDVNILYMKANQVDITSAGSEYPQSLITSVDVGYRLVFDNWETFDGERTYAGEGLSLSFGDAEKNIREYWGVE